FFMICPKSTLLRSNGCLCSGPESGQACRQYCPELPVEKIPDRLAIARALLMHAKVVVSPSVLLMQVFQREFGDLKIELVRHGLTFHPRTCNLQRYSPGDALVFCYAGSLTPHTGVHTLLAGFMSVRSPKASLKIYATGAVSDDYVAKLKQTAQAD